MEEAVTCLNEVAKPRIGRWAEVWDFIGAFKFN